MSEKIRYSYYTSAQASQNTFYRLPRALYEKEYFKVLSNDAKTLYALMLDRMSLSVANDWLDSDGKVYINYSLEDIMETLNCGKTKAVELLKELDSETGIGLIEKRKMGIARASVFYVKNFVFENRTHTCPESEPDRVQNPNPNKTNINKTEKNKTKIISINPTEKKELVKEADTEEVNKTYMMDGRDKIDEEEQVQIYQSMIKENVDYEIMMSNYQWREREMYEELYQIICDVVCVPRKTIRIAGEDYPYSLVKSKFLKLNSSHLQYVIGCMERNTSKVLNIRAYLITALYNAPNTMKHYFPAEVNHDMYGVG